MLRPYGHDRAACCTLEPVTRWAEVNVSERKEGDAVLASAPITRYGGAACVPIHPGDLSPKRVQELGGNDVRPVWGTAIAEIDVDDGHVSLPTGRHAVAGRIRSVRSLRAIPMLLPILVGVSVAPDRSGGLNACGIRLPLLRWRPYRQHISQNAVPSIRMTSVDRTFAAQSRDERLCEHPLTIVIVAAVHSACPV